MKTSLTVFILLVVGGLFAGPAHAGVEIGTNDQRLSDMGTNSDTTYDASDAVVAYNSTDNVYLVVWSADDNEDGVINNEQEIYGQFVNGDGDNVGPNDFRISIQGANGDATIDSVDPAIAYDVNNNQFLVVWSGDRIAGEEEIFGQLVAANGTLVGVNFRISTQGTDGATAFDAAFPDVAFNATNSEFLVAWTGDRIAGEDEVYVQLVSATGIEVGSDTQISTMGTDGTTAIDAADPVLAWNSTDNQYLVVWSGDDQSNGQDEIYGQLLSNVLLDLGSTDFRISSMGPEGNTSFDAFDPGITYNATQNEYLVVWHGDDNTAPLVDSEREIFAQRISNAGAEVGTDDIRVSFQGTNSSTAFLANQPRVVHNSSQDTYLVVWHGDTGTAGEDEIFGQELSNSGALVGSAFVLSSAGPNGSTAYRAIFPGIAYNDFFDEILVAWHGDDNDGGQVDGEEEIRAQLWGYVIPVDTDLDGVRDSVDQCPGFDDTVDPDLDGVPSDCDKCPNDYDPNQEDADNDGTGDACEDDDDNDGVSDSSDCRPLDDTLWTGPGPSNSLMVTFAGSDNLSWAVPVSPGGVLVDYDVLRSSDATDFSAATCVESNGGDRVATDNTAPSPGNPLFYLIRSENVCGDHLGAQSDATLRTGLACP